MRVWDTISFEFFGSGSGRLPICSALSSQRPARNRTSSGGSFIPLESARPRFTRQSPVGKLIELSPIQSSRASAASPKRITSNSISRVSQRKISGKEGGKTSHLRLYSPNVLICVSLSSCSRRVPKEDTFADASTY